ncbi:MAG: hypothetical protein C5B51_05580 [Terriglobia bacterium]|nr:MAG: hypothetical protein C5B51_05580 [Terriglobia bacterium]
MFKASAVFLLLPLLSFGQLTSNSVTVSTSQPGTVQPDQAVFVVSVTSATDKGLDDILKALAGSGITAANLAGIRTAANPVQSVPQPQMMLFWSFRLIVPLSKVKDTTAMLSSLQQTLPKPDFSLSFGVQGTQASGAATTPCNYGELFNQARTEAQKIAGAAGLSAGAIIGINTSVPSCAITVRYALGLMLGQAGPYTIGVTVSRAISPQPDQVVILLTVSTGLTANFDEVAGALQAAGINGANFSSVDTVSFSATTGTPVRSFLQWSFTLVAPLAKLRDTLSLLAAAQQNIAKQGSGMSFSSAVEGVQASTAAQQSLVCPEADLISDARGQAQKLGAAAGVSAGSILSLSQGTAGLSLIQIPVLPVLRLGDFTAVWDPAVTPQLPPPTLACSLTVQFQLGG